VKAGAKTAKIDGRERTRDQRRKSGRLANDDPKLRDDLVRIEDRRVRKLLPDCLVELGLKAKK
jgi:hypothetical protein